MIEPFKAAVPVLEKLEDHGFSAYFVGGSVRDYLLSRPIHDVDIATSATPEEVKQLFTATVDIGIEHGTVLVLYNKNSYEITTFRTEGEYQDYRRPSEVAFVRNLLMDLERRDFTMNAIAMDRSGKIIDPFQGQAAIQEKVIQTVGQAEDRFREDALRMMRAIRFVSQLSFQIENETLKALSQHISLLEKIAVERKRAEFEKLLVGENQKDAIKIMVDTNLYSYLPGLQGQRKSIEKLLDFNLLNLNLIEMWSLLTYCMSLNDESIEPFLRAWRLPIKDIKNVKQILFYLQLRLSKEWSLYDLYTAGRDVIRSVEQLYSVINQTGNTNSAVFWLEIYEKLPIKQRSDLEVAGGDLMGWFNLKGGPWLKEKLIEIEHAILLGKIENKKEMIKEWLLPCSQK